MTKNIVILLILMLFIFGGMLICIFSYRQGLKDCYKILEKNTLYEKETGTAKIEEDISMINIENYRGDGEGQIDLEDS